MQITIIVFFFYIKAFPIHWTFLEKKNPHFPVEDINIKVQGVE